jgi:hypothetical protein
MLSFAIKYRRAIEDIISERKNNLWQFELTEGEWAIASELSDVLKVRVMSLNLNAVFNVIGIKDP